MRYELQIGLPSHMFDPRRKMHCVFLDYDGMSSRRVVNNCRMLQKKHMLPNFHIYRTGRGFHAVKRTRRVRDTRESGGHFHAVCFTQLPFSAMMEVVFDSLADPKFKRFTLQKRFATLRITPKGGKPVRYYMPVRGNKITLEERRMVHVYNTFLEAVSKNG